jgi:predicted AAA+ superfamily ATPase
MQKSQKITRTLQTQLVEAMGFYPIVTLTGPRQSGKTTLAKVAAPQLPYVNLENPKDRALATYDPESFLARYPDGAILDPEGAPIGILASNHCRCRRKKGSFFTHGKS